MADPVPDPGGAQEAIERYRDLAKYLIAIFAAVGAVLVAGTQLSAVGQLSWSESPDRLVAAMAGFVLAMAAVIGIVWRTVGVLKPIEMSLDDVVADPTLRADIDSHRSMLGDFPTVARFKRFMDGPVDDLDDEARDGWLQRSSAIVGRAACLRAAQRFERAWRGMLIGTLVGVLGVLVFIWGSNPPDAATADPSVDPSPVLVGVVLTEAGQEALGEALGEECARRQVVGISIGGEERMPKIVVLPRGGCRPAQFLLAPSLGTAFALRRAPSR